MKSILFIAFLAIATMGCHTPEKSTDSDTSTMPSTMSTDTTSSSTTPSTMTTPSDSTMATPVDTTGGAVKTDSTMNR